MNFNALNKLNDSVNFNALNKLNDLVNFNVLNKLNDLVNFNALNKLNDLVYFIQLYQRNVVWIIRRGCSAYLTLLQKNSATHTVVAMTSDILRIATKETLQVCFSFFTVSRPVSENNIDYYNVWCNRKVAHFFKDIDDTCHYQNRVQIRKSIKLHIRA